MGEKKRKKKKKSTKQQLFRNQLFNLFYNKILPKTI